MQLAEQKSIEKFQQKATEDNLLLLPLFTGKNTVSVTPVMLHKSYYPDISVSSIMFNNRATNVLRAAGIKTVGELLLTSYVDLLLYRNCGIQTVEVFQNGVKSYIFDKKYDYSPYWDDLESMLRNVITLKERNFSILTHRLGINLNKPYTLQRCGDMFGITREAVRQTLNQVYEMLCHPEIEFRLRPFWTTVDKAIRKRELISSDDLAKKIREKLSWKVKPEAHAIEKMLSIKDDKYNIAFNHLVGFADSPCFSCDKIDGLLPKIMKGKIEAPYREVYNAFYEVMEQVCPRVKSLKMHLAVLLVELQVHRSLSQYRQFRKKSTYIVNQKLVS